MRLRCLIHGTLIAMALLLSSATYVLAQISPVLVGSLSIADFNRNNISDIAVSNGFAYTTLSGGDHGTSGLGIFDVSNPTQPFDVGYRDGLDEAVALTVSGTNAY